MTHSRLNTAMKLGPPGILYGSSIAPQGPLTMAHPATSGDVRMEAQRTTLTAVWNHRVLEQAVQRLSRRYGIGADTTQHGLPDGFSASLYSGAAGIAYALARVGSLTNTSSLLAAAELWNARALVASSDVSALALDNGRDSVSSGKLALFQSRCGVHLVGALVHRATGDVTATRQAVRDFIDSVDAVTGRWTLAEHRCEPFSLDTTDGASSLLLGVTRLMSLCSGNASDVTRGLHRLGLSLSRQLEIAVEAKPRLENSYLGFAHGLSGVVFSMLRWTQVSATPVPAWLVRHLDRLMAAATPHGDGLAWPIHTADSQSPRCTGWCHGSAGHLLTCSLASRVLGKSDYIELAAAAGRHIWARRGHSGSSLCCGSAGEALALLELARVSEDPIWLDRGLALAHHSAHKVDTTDAQTGLFHADVGVSLAAAEAMQPELAIWPVLQAPV